VSRHATLAPSIAKSTYREIVTGQRHQDEMPARTTSGWGEPEDALADVAIALLGRGDHRVVHLLDVLERAAGAPADVVRAGDDLLP
jgi:hypothetical protein